MGTKMKRTTQQLLDDFISGESFKGITVKIIPPNTYVGDKLTKISVNGHVLTVTDTEAVRALLTNAIFVARAVNRTYRNGAIRGS